MSQEIIRISAATPIVGGETLLVFQYVSGGTDQMRVSAATLAALVSVATAAVTNTTATASKPGWNIQTSGLAPAPVEPNG